MNDLRPTAQAASSEPEGMLAEEALEALWEQLSDAIDRAGPAHETLFLAKLVLLLARLAGNPAAITVAIEQALEDLS